ncbi:MAG TPA: hypothetical protein VL307_15065 [Chitinophagaceae bacterium]|jgi:hypothetical protein|nr:hypothetical protein [Chitinophagaceae bacterium]
MALTKIDEYEVMYSGNKFPPRIWLKNSGKFIGQLVFEPDGSVLPADALINGQANIFYHLQQYAHCIDLLRNEQPMYLLFTAGSAENGIKTTAETVGDGE